MKKTVFLQILLSFLFSQVFAQSKIPFLPNYTQESIKSIAQGQRPEPSTYLEASYIKHHLKQFRKGASYLVPQAILDRFGRQKLGRADGQFVMAKKQMDKLLKQANGKLDFVEKQLGIPAGAWKDKVLVRIDVLNPQKLHLRIPNGNESAANDLWLPGGKLPTGYFEAVVDQIPEGTYTEKVVDLK